jgi:hypothetical protein
VGGGVASCGGGGFGIAWTSADLARRLIMSAALDVKHGNLEEKR